MCDRLKKRLISLFSRPSQGREQGFTLIEVAIVLVIVSLLIGMGMQSMSRMLDNAKIKTTTDRMAKLEDAITLFVIKNQYLPCPADGSLASAGAAYGLSQPNTATATCVGATAATAVIPWRTLGIDELLTYDGWGRRIAYHVASNLYAVPVVGARTTLDTLTDTDCMMRENATTTTVRPAACDPPTADIEPSYPYGNYLRVINAAGTELTADQPAAAITAGNVAKAGGRAAYVLISHGRNGTGGYGHEGAGPITGSPPAGANELINVKAAGGEGLFVQNDPIDIVDGTFFDDIVRWRTPSSIIASCGTGACGN